MRQILELGFGVPHSLNAVYAILHRNGFSCLIPRTPVRVLFQDEARFGQQGTLSTVWAPTGSRPSAIRQNGRKSIWIFAAVEPATGWSTAMTFRRANTGSMQDSSTMSARGSGRGSTPS